MNSNNQVKQLRLQRAWSQEQLAEMAGLSVRTIQRIENGERPGLETLSALAAVFEVTVAEIGGEASREGAPGPEASLDLRIEEAKARVHQESRFFRSLSVALVVCVLLAVLNRFTNPQYYWSGWVALIWGVHTPCDIVIVAIGQAIDARPFAQVMPLERGKIKASSDAFVPNTPHVFAGGDAVTGAATVIKAMGAGKTAAKSIDEYIKSKQ